MLWLTWRQYRVALLVSILLLALTGLLFLGETLRYITLPMDIIALVPLLIAIFVGAPFVSRELERKTHYIVWEQGTSRTRWFFVRLAWVSLGVIVVAALFTWSESVMSGWRATQLSLINIDAVNIWTHAGIAPIPLSLFGLMLGVTVGCFTRKSIVAMVVTFILFLMAGLIYNNSSHYLIPPHVQYIEYQGDKALWGKPEELVLYAGFADRQGHETGSPENYCRANDPNYKGNVNQCVRDLNLQWKVVYQTPDRYWPLQFAGAGLLLAVSFVLAIIAFLRVRSVVD